MAVKLTDEQSKLLDDPKALIHLATIYKDGSPQVSPGGVDFDGTHVVIKSE